MVFFEAKVVREQKQSLGNIVIDFFFDVLLTVHLCIFISVFNQLDARNLFYNKFYFTPLRVSSTCAHHQEVSCTRRPPIGVMIPEAV